MITFSFTYVIPRSIRVWYWKWVEQANLEAAENEELHEMQARSNARVYHARAALASSKAREN